MVEKACKNCRVIVTEEKCPICNESNLTKNWEGYIFVFDPNGEVGKAINAKVPGKYALKIESK